MVTRDIGELDCSALEERVGGRLLDVGAPLAACPAGRNEQEAATALASLRNPYAVEDDPGAFHTTGWHGAHVSAHSPRVVAAESAADIAAAVDFAREHGAGLVVKGTGHDYLGRSCAPGSLMIWTHRMREVTVHGVAGADGIGMENKRPAESLPGSAAPVAAPD